MVHIERLAKHHDRKTFDCGKDELNVYIRTLARQHQELGFVLTYVSIQQGSPRVLGYVSLAMGNVLLDEADPEVYRRLPKHPMPVLHVARLATDHPFAGRGIGSLLLAHAAKIALEASRSIGVYALELIAIDNDAYQYYLRRGFLPLRGDSRRLYAPLETIRRTIEEQ